MYVPDSSSDMIVCTYAIVYDMIGSYHTYDDFKPGAPWSITRR